MKNTRLSLALKAAAFSLLGILILSGIFIGANRLIFATATGGERNLDTINPVDPVLTRADAIPEDYPFPEFSLTYFTDERVSPNALSPSQAAEIGSRYIWEMFGANISGKTMHLHIDNFPSSTRTHWEGLIWSEHPVYDFVIHYLFSIDSVTGERISIAVGDWFPSEAVGESVSEGNYERLIEIFAEIAMDYAQRHFNFTTVANVVYDGMRNLADYTAYMECDEGLLHPVMTERGFPCHAIMNGETMLDFIATDETGRTARIVISMETMRLNALTTQHNDIVPGFEFEAPPFLPNAGEVAMYPRAAPFLTVYLGPNQPAWAMQIPPYTDFLEFDMDPAPTLNLTHNQDLPLDWQYISMDFTHELIPEAVFVFRRRVEGTDGQPHVLENIDIMAPGGWMPGLYEYKIPIFDDGFDYFYFVRTVWPEGYAFNIFRVNSGSHPELEGPLPAPTPIPGPVWAVQPNLPHDHITLCNAGNYVNSQRRVIDPQTGQLTGDFCDGHGGPPPDFVFDPERLLFGHPSYGNAYHPVVGMHTMEDFKAIEDRWVQQNSSGLIAVESVDSSLRQSDYSLPWEYWWLTEEAFSGHFALMYNLQFVTDFIFDNAPSWWHRYRFAFDENTGEHSMVDMQFIAVSMEGMWGLVNKSGDVIIPFIFENLILINENTAFANYNGRHGILDIPGSIAAFGGVR